MKTKKLFIVFLIGLLALPLIPLALAAPSISIDAGATTSIDLIVSITVSSPGSTHMRFSNDNITWSGWEALATPKTWSLTAGADGLRTVYAEFTNGMTVNRTFDTIILDQSVSLTINTAYPDIITLDTLQSLTMNYTLTLMNTARHYQLILTAGVYNQTDNVMPGYEYVLAYLNETVEANITGVTSHTGEFTVDVADYIPFNGLYTYLGLLVWGYNTTGYILESDSAMFKFNITQTPPTDTSMVTYLSIQDCDPYNQDLNGLQVCNRGVTMKATSITVVDTTSATSDMTYHADPVTISCFVCNRTSNVIVAYGTRQVMFEHENDLYFIDQDIPTPLSQYHNLEWTDLVWGKTVFNPRENYTVYFGVDYDDYDDTDFVLTTDGTVQPINFSVSDDPPSSGDTVAAFGIEANDYIGWKIYFETFQGTGDVFPTGWTTDYNDVNIGQGIRDYFDNLGLGWVAMVFSFMIPILCVGIVYQYMRKWKISLPSYLYSLPLAAGFTISYAVGLMILWVFVFGILGCVFSVAYHFKEPINEALEVVKGGDIVAGERTRMREARLEGGATRRTMLKSARIKDEGLLPTETQEITFTQGDRKIQLRRIIRGYLNKGYSEDEAISATAKKTKYSQSTVEKDWGS